jgi:hypothetical protein
MAAGLPGGTLGAAAGLAGGAAGGATALASLLNPVAATDAAAPGVKESTSDIISGSQPPAAVAGIDRPVEPPVPAEGARSAGTGSAPLASAAAGQQRTESDAELAALGVSGVLRYAPQGEGHGVIGDTPQASTALRLTLICIVI